MTRQIVNAAAIGAALTLCGQIASAQRADVRTWRLDGETRRAIVYPPSKESPTGRVPLVFSFHGRGDDVENFQHVGLHGAWPEAIVVYFQGLTGRGGVTGWQVETGQDDDRDLALVDAALASFRKEFKVDEARIYSTGFSNGAAFTYLLWAARPAVFAAFAPVAGRLRPPVQLKQPKPLFHVAGTGDPQVLFSDQQVAIEAAKRVNGVTGSGTSCGNGCTLYSSGAAPVMTWIHRGGHDYPQSTSERIAKFFREHPRR
jgi:polyhydroxybutyrate depolymerase